MFIALLGFTVLADGQVYVGGELTENTIFIPANNPYIVTQDLIVPKNITLTILPGVEMQFEYGTSLIANGTLVAMGTKAQKIQFLPKIPVTLPAQWNGLVFNNSSTLLGSDSSYSSGSVLSDAVISNASYSVTLADFTSLLIENTRISMCSFGIYLKESGYNIIRSCDFKDCNFGIFLASGYTNPGNKIYLNNIRSCLDVGIFINSSAEQSSYNLIKDNHIDACNIGLHIGNYNNNGEAHNTVSGNSFVGNKDAIKLFQQLNTISNNYFILNRGGVSCWESGYNTISQNLFSRNFLNAITLSAGSSYNNITNNAISYNGGGISIKPDSSRNSLNNNCIYNTLTHNRDFSIQFQNISQGPVQFNNIAQNSDFQSFKNLSDNHIHAEYNYWGSTSETTIDSIIFDLYDVPEQGEVYYRPVLDKILTIAPVPPPDHVIKQRIGNDIVISWDSVAITDLRGYNVYYGSTDNITYQHKILNGLDTTINMGNFPIDDTLVVTAFDFQSDGRNDQTEGYESDFAFAYQAPYAGPDTAICFSSVYSITRSTSFDYENLTWSTSGDGLFNDIHILNPIYSPGPQDYLKGYAYLYLNDAMAEMPYTDVAYITFLNAPEVYAGSDTTIIVDSALFLKTAAASGYNSVKWSSVGDGTFNSDTISNPLYFPGPADIVAGEVTLTFEGFSFCGSTSDQVLLTIAPGYSIEGRIHAGAALAPNSSISVFSLEQGSIRPVRAEYMAADGAFEIRGLLAGTYYLYAIPDKTESPEYLPTYFFNDIRWGNAHKLELSANTYDVDIDLARTLETFPTGEGSIRGYCTSEPGVICTDVTILLYDKQMKNILDWLLVRKGNNFNFRNLPFGEYVLSGEKTGSIPFYSGRIVLSASQPDIENIELVCTPAGYKFSVPGNLTPESTPPVLAVFPNPVNDRLFISGLSDFSACSIRVYDSQGRVLIFQHDLNSTDNNSLLLGQLPSGFYSIEIWKNDNCLLRQKLIKN